MLYVIKLINKLQSFITMEISISLLRVKSMRHSKLVDDSNYVTYFLFHKILNSMSINKYSKFLTCIYLKCILFSKIRAKHALDAIYLVMNIFATTPLSPSVRVPSKSGRNVSSIASSEVHPSATSLAAASVSRVDIVHDISCLP